MIDFFLIIRSIDAPCCTTYNYIIDKNCNTNRPFQCLGMFDEENMVIYVGCQLDEPYGFSGDH